MPDPRFDGSLDAPSFVDRADDCSDCGRARNHPAHDGRNPDGHFFNEGAAVIVDRFESRFEPAPRTVLAPATATLTPAPPAPWPVVVKSDSLPEEPEEPKEVEEEPEEERCAAEEPETALSGESSPDGSWQKSIEALRSVEWPVARNLCALALRFAPRPATFRDLSTVIHSVHPRRCNSSTVTAVLSGLRKEGLAVTELREGTDIRGNPRMIAYWSPTDALRASFTETAPSKHHVNRYDMGLAARKRNESRSGSGSEAGDDVATEPTEPTLADKIRAKIEWHLGEVRKLEIALEVLVELEDN